MTVPPPPQHHLPPLHHHRHSTCHRHPSKPITGFCACCLRERLAGIDPDTHQETPLTHLAAELRRCKSYSCSSNLNNASSSSTSTTATNPSDQPRRKSCDVRSRNTLSDLFNSDDSKKRFSFNSKLKVEKLCLDLKEEEEENEGIIRVFDEVSERNVDDFDEDGEFKTMKEFIDLEWETKKNGGKDFSFWNAASVFRNKLVKWQLKQKKKSDNSHKKENQNGGVVDGDKPSVRRLRDTQSEIGEYGLGRRSCDTDPRFSIDMARLSVDDSRYSFDEPRASWDGYLIGKTYPRLAPLVAVLEDAKLSANGIENQNEALDLNKEGESSPGGTAQTKEFYSDRRRRKSFDRLSSNRRLTLGDEEFKSISNTKVSPEIGLFHGAKLLVTEKELRDSNWYSLKDYHRESSDALAKDVDSIAAKISKKGFKFKNKQKWRSVWNIWGLMQRRNGSKCEDEESSIGGNEVDERIEESVHKVGGVASVEANETVSQKLIRSYTVSTRDASKMACSASSITDVKMLQRNKSARYSPSHLDNGMLRFYLTPLRSYGRSKSGRSRLQNSHPTARNVP
ncbi:protein OCTOPUS-like [Mercurialis annua]|uniref:protein OCTOPUS-like n=1 Tax=Mercurialis annua TaxID=3986 RepID=UPI002160FBE2|nr:protein OCTOPUS-like [Mercurialis annua]